MLSIVLGIKLLYVHIKSVDALALAMIVVIVSNPISVITASFWLSFSAVALILYVLALETMRRESSRFLFWCNLQFWICLGLSPVMAKWFNQVSFWSLLANMVAIPWISLITLPLLLAGTSLSILISNLSNLIFELAVISLEYLWYFLETVDRTGLVYHPVPSPYNIAHGHCGSGCNACTTAVQV